MSRICEWGRVICLTIWTRAQEEENNFFPLHTAAVAGWVYILPWEVKTTGVLWRKRLLYSLTPKWKCELKRKSIILKGEVRAVQDVGWQKGETASLHKGKVSLRLSSSLKLSGWQWERSKWTDLTGGGGGGQIIWFCATVNIWGSRQIIVDRIGQGCQNSYVGSNGIIPLILLIFIHR